jgi:Putative Ig domain
MSNPIWITGQGTRTVNLGTVTEGVYFEYPIEAYDPRGGSVTYKFLAGDLPPGIRVNPLGIIQGGPYLNTVINQSTSYEFTVRASDQHGLISDKTFAMSIANINPPIISPRTNNLGEIFDGEFYSLQLYASELNPYATLSWSLVSGTLPIGLSLSSTGLISGFTIPLATYGNGGSQGYNTTPYNEFGYENSATYQTNNYTFTVKVFDGANYDSLTYTLIVTAKDQYSADSTLNTVDNTYLTIDQDNGYIPVMLTPSQSLPEVRSNSKFAFQFQGLDPNGNQLTYALSLSSSGAAGFDQEGTQGFDTVAFDQQNLSVPPGLILDGQTGWFSGTVGSQVQAVQEYSFQVYCYETGSPTVQSVPITYKMSVLGDITNTIIWSTNYDLGYIDNGAVSELSVTAVNKSGRVLTYSLVSDGSHLPQGLQLQTSGLITGRVGFEFFSLDNGTTTIDGMVSNFDNIYNFTVQATNTDSTASIQQSFKITVNNYNMTPYENIYIKALPSIDQRNTFLSIVNNTDIFPEELIYRSSDPNFGRARDIRSLFLAGLNPTDISDYLTAMGTNTYNKRIEFSNIKTAMAVDENFNTKYEVVYIELKDDQVYKGNSPANSRLDTLINETLYPNSFKNMTSVITNATGYANPGAIPNWMSSPQSDKKVLGFTRAIVLAYTTPGASKLIAYRLAANGIVFNNINFVVDRYDLDNSYSANYNIVDKTYDLGKETTFDRIKRPGIIVTSVTYGIRGLAFNMINNQTVSQINARGGLDGVTNYSNGETLIFLQQENYAGETGLYDGWIGTSIIPGFTENLNSINISSGTAGLPSSPSVGQVAVVNNVYYMFSVNYDSNGNVTSTAWKIANLRANVWKINIDINNKVTLTPSTFLRKVGSGTSLTQVNSMIVASDRVQINHGQTQSESIVYYNTALSGGNSVPEYTNIPTMLADAVNNTRFDGYGTRFINNRISHEEPESGDIWLKFPSTGPLG